MIKAIYIAPRGVSDGGSTQFSCPVVKTQDGQWKLQTAHGLQTIDYYLAEPLAIGGVIEWRDYDIQLEPGLRAVDAMQIINAYRSALPLPHKPSTPPQVNTEPDDTRLHLPERIGTESSMRQVQRAYAEQTVSAERKERLRRRNEAQSDPTNAYAAQSRRLANQFAAMKRPRRQGEN